MEGGQPSRWQGGCCGRIVRKVRALCRHRFRCGSNDGRMSETAPRTHTTFPWIQTAGVWRPAAERGDKRKWRGDGAVAPSLEYGAFRRFPMRSEAARGGAARAPARHDGPQPATKHFPRTTILVFIFSEHFGPRDWTDKFSNLSHGGSSYLFSSVHYCIPCEIIYIYSVAPSHLPEVFPCHATHACFANRPRRPPRPVRLGRIPPRKSPRMPVRHPMGRIPADRPLVSLAREPMAPGCPSRWCLITPPFRTVQDNM
jgi:hypothetical protein